MKNTLNNLSIFSGSSMVIRLSRLITDQG